MNKIKKITIIFSVVFLFLIAEIPFANSNAVLSYSYQTKTSSISPKIVYNNSTIPYVKITIYNSQTVSTGNNFQMLVKVNWLEYKDYLNGNCSNVRFYNTTSALGKTSGYGVLPAWIETNDTNTSTSSNVWINMKGTIIPASGSVNIYMAFLPKSVSWNAYLGLNPTLSSTYGQFDNGANVFLYYNNGLNLMPLINKGTGGTGPATTNSAPSPFKYAITGSVNGGTADANTWTTNGITSSSSPSFNLPTSYIAQMKVYLSGSSALTDLLTNVQNIVTGQFYVFRFDTRSNTGYNDGIGYYSSGATITTFLNLTNIKSQTNVWYQMTAIDNSDNLYLYKNQYSSPSTFTLDNYGTLEANAKGVGYSGGGIAVTTDGATSTEYWTMIIVRSFPPNGVMPSYSFSCLYSKSFWQANLNSYKDEAYVNITDIWASSIYTQENDTTVFADSYGNLIISWNGGVSRSYVQSPYIIGYKNLTGKISCEYLGPIVSVAAMNISYPKRAFIDLLTQNGAIFELNETYRPFTWVEVAKLPGTNWTSVTTNLKGEYYNYQEYFFYTNYNGTVYARDIYNNSKPFIWNSNTSSRVYYADCNWWTGTNYSSRSLPGAEEFTVWPNSAVVNYIGLGIYVQTTGYINISIGTSLWGDDILSNQTYYLGSTGESEWIFQIPPITLHRNQYYYLNVWPTTKNEKIYWLYATGSAIDNGSYNYLQDYWYQGSKLHYDNTHPYLFAIFYQGQPNIISTVAYYNGYLYGLSWNGTVWMLTTNGWRSYSYINNTNEGFKGITLQQGSSQSNSYLYVMNIYNNTPLYVSSNIGNIHMTFNATNSIISNYGTNEAITYDVQTKQLKFIQTNGTVGYSGSTIPGTYNIAWNYNKQVINQYYTYPTILQINSTYPVNFYAYAYLLKAINYTYLYNFSLYFTGSDGNLRLQLAYQYGSSLNNYAYPVLLNNLKNVLINVTMKANMAFNVRFYLYTVLYTSQNGVVFYYVLNIRIINHFSYIPLGG